jgi:hypothetical protein
VIQLKDVRFFAKDLESSTIGLRSDLSSLTQLKKIILVVPEYDEHMVKDCRVYFKYACLMLSSLKAQASCRARKSGVIKRKYPDVYLPAMRKGGKVHAY